jgi:predicted HTH domain antitoxin
MAQNPHDQLAKSYLEEFLLSLGKVERQYEVPGEAKFVDVWFVPSRAATPVEDLGLLGRMAEKPALFEPYRDVPTRTKVRVSVMKLVWVQEDERRKAQKDELPEDELPMLWILAATTSRPLLRAANVVTQPGWPSGVYFMGDLLKTAIVAIDQLPVVPETLLLRVLGRDETQKVAIEEVIALPVDSPQRWRILRLVASWKVRIEMGELDGFIQREEIMTITKAFVVWEEEKKDEGRQEGRQEKEIEIALNLLREQISLETIARTTGLTIAQLEQLRTDANP